ncbi:MAG: Hsp20/alpha crystallin family protein [Pseudomonadota bacterium]
MPNNLTRFDPFGRLARFDPLRNVDDMFSEFGLSPRARFANMAPRVRMDITENEQAYLVKAEVPGVSKEDIKVNIDGNQVTISAEVKKETEQQGEASLYSERRWGQYYRSFTLPQAVDDATAKAEYRQGVLELTLPKKGNGSRKTLQVL